MDDRTRPGAGHRAPVVGRAAARLSYLFVCDEWLPTTGGISVVNRELATAVAARGHRTTCLVRSATPAEVEDAAGRGVRLVLAERTPFGPDLHLPVAAVLDDPPAVVVGHDRITGHIAWLYARRFGRARLVHLVHTAPAEIEAYKDRDGAALRTRRGRPRRDRWPARPTWLPA